MGTKLSIKIFLLCFFLGLSLVNAQDTYKRVKIAGSGQAFLQKLLNAEVDLTCGAVFQENSVQLELSEHELASVAQQGLTYEVLIEDLTAFYQERAQRFLPLARRNLELQKSFKKLGEPTPLTNGAQASQSVSQVFIGNIAQRTAQAQETDWAEPTNFVPGTMGGAYTVSELEAVLDDMRAKFPNLISVKANISPTNQKTWEGRDVWYVRISDNPDSDENEPESLITGMLHSREAVAQINIIYYMWYLLENYATDPSIKNLVDNAELYFIPTVNPDGLFRNEDVAPGGGGMQRKNLRNVCAGQFSQIQGTDLNRNFGYFYNTGGTSSSTCNDTYRGPSAFSEPETQMFRDFSLAHDFKTAQNHHTSANVMVHPFSGITANPQAIDELTKFSHDITEFNRYVYGPVQQILTLASGDSNEWMRGGVNDGTGSTGSGRGTWAVTAESGNSAQEGSFWPNPLQIVDISKRAMRMNFVNSFYAGKFAKLHDLTQSDITTLTPTLQFGIERLGQTDGNFTLEIIPVSANILSVTNAPTQTGMTKLEMRNINVGLTLSNSITPREEIVFNVRLSNEDHIIYEAEMVKYFSPIVLFFENAEAGNLSNWTTAGGSWANTNADAFNGNRAIADASTVAYGNGQAKAIISPNVSFTPAPKFDNIRFLVQFYTKWDLERNFDFVSFQGSTDGSSWVDLFGNYTKPAAGIFVNDRHTNTKSETSQAFQDLATHVYDGDQMNKWVMEEILIDPNHNAFLFDQPNVQFRFLFRSDSNNVASGATTSFDGFFFDDFKITKIDEPTLSLGDELIAEESIKVFPNPFVEEIQIKWAQAQGEAFTANIYDIQGRLVYSKAFDTQNGVINLQNQSLSGGLYLLKLKSESGLEQSQKIVKI
ncbi:MAG: T9SS type A sorting domain-containing protein [Bacteroidetes bacterium]|nr:T9SS type A sorting domain-containing protein [Bacteroidota bacterium]